MIVTTNIPIEKHLVFEKGVRVGRLEAFKEIYDDVSQYREELLASQGFESDDNFIQALDYILGRTSDLSVCGKEESKNV